jgi:hypothetical protein
MPRKCPGLLDLPAALTFIWTRLRRLSMSRPRQAARQPKEQCDR